MNAETINSVIDNLAAKLSVPVAELMAAIPAFAIMDAITVIFGVALLVLSGVFVLATMKAHNNGYEGWVITHVTLAILTGVAGFCCTVVSLSSVALWLYDPHAWAVHYLLELFK